MKIRHNNRRLKIIYQSSFLCYYGYRYYSSELGRWINRDPIAEEGGVNIYAYVSNESINKIDFLGLECPKTFDIPGYILDEMEMLWEWSFDESISPEGDVRIEGYEQAATIVERGGKREILREEGPTCVMKWEGTIFEEDCEVKFPLPSSGDTELYTLHTHPSISEEYKGISFSPADIMVYWALSSAKASIVYTKPMIYVLTKERPYGAMMENYYSQPSRSDMDKVLQFNMLWR